jgi:hypothetical protein
VEYGRAWGKGLALRVRERVVEGGERMHGKAGQEERLSRDGKPTKSITYRYYRGKKRKQEAHDMET